MLLILNEKTDFCISCVLLFLPIWILILALDLMLVLCVRSFCVLDLVPHRFSVRFGAFPIFFNSAPDLVFSAAARTERISRAPDFLLLSEQALPYPVSRYGFRSVLGEGATLDSFFVD
jgi:hypothetical protein